MMLSMTGFSSGTVQVPGNNGSEMIEFAIELKSLNSRFFELSSRLPISLNAFETDFIAVLKKKLLRGRIYLTMHVVGGEDTLAAVTPALGLAKSYCDAMQEIAKHCNLSDSVQVRDLLSIPNLFVVERARLSEHALTALTQGLERMAVMLNEQRSHEGAALQADMQARFAVCAQKIAQISKQHEVDVAAHKAAIQAAQAQAVEGDIAAQAKLEELYVQLNKMDVSEEITRFGSHLERVTEVFNARDVEKGKRLDFLTQEFLREINTISAKCSNAAISSLTVDVKVELEKIREQVQNVL